MGKKRNESSAPLTPSFMYEKSLLWFSKEFKNTLVVFHLGNVGQEKLTGARTTRNLINSEALREPNF